MFSLSPRVVSQASSSARSFSTSSILSSTKKGGGSSKNNRESNPKHLGPKVYNDGLVQPGSIIIRQRGLKIHPGQHVSVGRDHTLSALIPGYVKYYMMPHNPKRGSLSPNLPNCRPRDWNWPADMKLPPTNRPLGWRKYVGVVLNRSDKLPRDEAKYGRERVFFGKQEGEVETGVFDFVPAGAEGEQGAREQGGFEKVREVKLVIPERPGRVVRGELLSAEEADLAEGKTVAA